MKLFFSALLATSLSAASADKTVFSVKDDLSFDESGKLAAHHMLYPAGNWDCPAATAAAPHGFEFRALAGEALQMVFPDYEPGSSACPVACPELGTDRSVAHAIMPHRRNPDSTNNFNDWFEGNCKRAEVCLINYHSRETPVKLFWVDRDGNPKLHMEIEYGERKTRCFHSFVGHRFQAQDGDTGAVVEEFTIEHTLSTAIGESPPSGDPQGHNFDREIESTLRHEWTKHERIQRTFSPLGFKKARLPDDVFASMGSFYFNNRNNVLREEWNGKGVFVNWWETDCYFVQIPWDLKGKWQERLRLLVEAWAGVPVEQTDMYGLRQYVEGARLLTHVDRESTHAVSLIVNIAQHNLTEPWPVEANDHADRLHEIIMQPGDIVYYESAKALHGRNRPLMGEDARYINLFTHYRPTGDPKWMLKANPEGTPEPVLEVKGECRLQTVGTAELPNKQLGIVEAVKCDDERLGDTISPTLFTATGGEDLIDWWKMTGANRKKATYNIE
ncbi:Ankyrin Repeat [Seminavis robusta]|uniref:Ankyrin Repeat n=1 Tax=Seminavis robusta TaxID=568900 RepID=A0A9N8ECU7_9STRA|nr:Ankyrin Repeat [Seminavis robusta]|eukprot:Sro988_g228370.1 Ankyrin Repeat (501) ;mRNA; f:17420-18922